MTAPEHPAVTDLPGVGRLGLALGLGAAPLAWTVHLVASVALVPHACDSGRSWPLHGVTLVTLAVAALGLGAAWRLGRAGRSGSERGAHQVRAGFLGAVGTFLGLLFSALIVIEGLPALFLDPCS